MAEMYEGFGMAVPDHWGLRVTKTYHSAAAPVSISPKNNLIPSDYVVLVTGASVGLGENMARQYLEAGANPIIITGRRPEPLEEARSKLEKLGSYLDRKVKVTAVSGDASRNESYAALVEHIEKEHGGRLDIMVCNAGPGQAGPDSWGPKVHTANIDDWDNMMGVNLNGPLYAAKNLIPLMLKPASKGKTIINIVSAGLHMTIGMPPPAYSIAKLATARLTQIMGEGYQEEGLQVFALHPGGVKTPGSLGQMPEAMHYMLVDHVDLAAGMCLRLSSKRPEWLNGRYVACNWDVDELTAQKDEIVAKNKFKFTMDV